MLRWLAVVPLLLASALLADEHDPLQQALARRVRQSERIVELTKKQERGTLFPTALLDAEIELAKAQLDASGPKERLEHLKKIVELCGRRMLLTEETLDAGKADTYLAERSRLLWFQARLRLMRTAGAASPAGPSEWQQLRMRDIAGEALQAARLRDEASERFWSYGVLSFESRAQAIEDRFRAEMEAAENDAERLAAFAKRSARFDDFALSSKLKFDASTSAGPCDDCYVAKDGALRATISLVLQMRDPTDEATWRELALHRAARLECLSTLFHILQGAVEERRMTVWYLDGLLTLSLDCPADLTTPAERRLVYERTRSMLDLVEKALRDPGRKERADSLELEFGWLERLRTNVEIWDLRRRAVEPPPPKVIPAE